MFAIENTSFDSHIIIDKPQANSLLPEDVLLRQERVSDHGDIELGLSLINRDRSQTLLGADKARIIVPSIGIRYNIWKDFSSNIKVPYIFSWRELPEDIDYTKNHQNFGIGDIVFCFNYQVLNENIDLPGLMLTLSIKSNTGNSPYSVTSNQEYLGTGHWQLMPGISFVKTIDPIIIFSGFSYDRSFARTIDRPIEFDSTLDKVKSYPGDAFNIVFGTAFAPNEKIAMSFKLLGSYILRDKIEQKSLGEIKTPFYFNPILDYKISNSNYIENSCLFGITKDANDLLMSIIYVHGF